MNKDTDQNTKKQWDSPELYDLQINSTEKMYYSYELGGFGPS